MAHQTPLIFAHAGRPFPGQLLSGDAWQVDWYDGICRVAVIDGLGHGPEAAAAADAAIAVLAGNPDLEPVAALYACHAALRATRGAAMWIGALDRANAHAVYAGVGNVDARILQEARQQRLIAQRGIVGATLPKVRGYDCPLARDWLLVVSTDGLHERFNLEDISLGLRSTPQKLVDSLLDDWARGTDDALVVAVCPRD